MTVTASHLDLSAKTALFTRMLEIRRFEEAIIECHAAGEITGHFHVYIGQEATGAAITSVLRTTDLVFSTHRNHGHFLGKGGDMAAAFAEILGRSTGCNRGMGGSLHLADPDIGMPHTSAVLGSAPALAMGAAFEMARRKDGRIAVAFFGDGALEEGVALEALNFASLWSLPVLFVCENNSEGAIGASKGGYPGSIMGTDRLTALPEAFRIETHSLDGNNLDGLVAVARDARARMAAGGGPVFLETLTPRWFGNQGLWPDLAHGPLDLGMATGAVPLPGDDAAAWFAKDDPLLRVAREVLAMGADAAEIARIDGAVAGRIAAALTKARAADYPTPEDARRIIRAGEDA